MRRGRGPENQRNSVSMLRPAVEFVRKLTAFTGVRARLSALVALTIVPLVALQLYELRNREAEQIAAAQHYAVFLARLTSERQNDLMQQAHDLLLFMREVEVLR